MRNEIVDLLFHREDDARSRTGRSPTIASMTLATRNVSVSPKESPVRRRPLFRRARSTSVRGDCRRPHGDGPCELCLPWTHQRISYRILGRAAFPLFAFAIACNLLRGTRRSGRTPQKLILLGIVSQPLYATLMASDEGDVTFTLSASAVLIVALRGAAELRSSALSFSLLSPQYSVHSFEFGLEWIMRIAGMLFPLCLLCARRQALAPDLAYLVAVCAELVPDR